MSLKEKGYESKEMYLESILILSKRFPSVRAKDIAKFMNFSKASVSRALAHLEEESFISRDENEFITLTALGQQRADAVYEKHVTLTKFLQFLGVDENIAEKDACKIEHVISDESFEVIKKFLNGR